MKHLLAVASVACTLLLVPHALAAGNFHYDDLTFPVPDGAGHQLLQNDCWTDPDSIGFGSCAQLRYRSYTGMNWSFSFFHGNKLQAPTEDEYGAMWSSRTLTNFRSLLEGKKTLADFYTADGLLKDKMQPVFELAPVWQGSNYQSVRDIEPITVDGKIIGYAFTPATHGGDFPPEFMTRVANLYDADNDLVINIVHILQYGETGAYHFLEEKGKKDAAGNIDYDYYVANPGALSALLNQHYEKYIAPNNLTAFADMTRVAQDLLMNKPVQVFSDVGLTDTYQDAIAFVKERGYVQGYADGTFGPKKFINRAEFIKILVAANTNLDISSYASQRCFTDVAAGQWYTQYICYAKTEGIIGGYPDGSFGTDKNINLAEALKIVLNTYNVPVPAEEANWFGKYMTAANDNFLLLRIKLNPADLLTREHMAELMAKVETSNGFRSYEE